MRAREFLREDAASVAQMQQDIVKAVKNTQDEDLLDRVYTTLNASGLHQRIKDVLAKNTDVRGFVNGITDIIIHTHGSYKDKFDFINGYPNGYVNVPLMLSGQRVHVDDLITGNHFVRKVFEQLKQYSPAGVKGPGEFALAVLSPDISIHSKGDLHINGKVIELKASAGEKINSGGGRLGTTGSSTLVKFDEIPMIIEKHTGVNVAVDVNVNFEVLSTLCRNIPEDKDKQAFAKELFTYMFKGANTSALQNALVSGDTRSLEREYFLVCYERYLDESKFDGMIVMNFSLGELQYFKDPTEMFNNLYSTNVYFVPKDKGHAGRQIFPQITLRPTATSKAMLAKKANRAKPKARSKKEPTPLQQLDTVKDIFDKSNKK